MSFRATFFPGSTQRKLEVQARLAGARDPGQAARAALQLEQSGGSKTAGSIVAATGDFYRGRRYDSGGWWDEGLGGR